MTGRSTAQAEQRNNPTIREFTIPELLTAIGSLMGDCHREALALQEAISHAINLESADVAAVTAYQRLDHVTQVHEELSRLLPAVAKAVANGSENPDELASNLRLVSLRDRLFGKGRDQDRPAPRPGEVSLF